MPSDLQHKIPAFSLPPRALAEGPDFAFQPPPLQLPTQQPSLCSRHLGLRSVLGNLLTVFMSLHCSSLWQGDYLLYIYPLSASLGRHFSQKPCPPNWLQVGAPLLAMAACAHLYPSTDHQSGPLLPGFFSHQNTSSISLPSNSTLQGPEQCPWSLISVCGLI